MKKYEFCQSCSYPQKNDKLGGGTEAGGTISNRFCSMCYQNGAVITPPEVNTAEKM
ncbi:MAG TPA: hypothetical protein DCE81_12225 [Cytophagales bacterium]|nr:hypothetical protein [Cytophagales bacterium]